MPNPPSPLPYYLLKSEGWKNKFHLMKRNPIGEESIGSIVSILDETTRKEAMAILQSVNRSALWGELISKFKEEHNHLGCEDGYKAGCETCDLIRRAEAL